MFVDRAEIVVKGGDGGRGAISFRKEAHVPRGGPDGGDGGRGADLVLRVDAGLGTLADLRYKTQYHAPDGAPGKGKDQSGRAGKDLVLSIPPGTLVIDRATGETVADLVLPGQELVAARGGRGGRGNARFASSVRRAPRIAEDGDPGEERTIVLELKLLADIGLAGLPNAGKSTLLAALTRAHPKIAAYPFTTLSPNLGVAALGGRELVVADIPGLIEGAHQGVGLGEEFLRHLERTRLIVHVVDAAQPDAPAGIRTVERELALHGRGLADRPRLYALNKTDLPDAREAVPALAATLVAEGYEALGVSAASGEGVDALKARLFQRCPPRAAAEVDPSASERRISFAKSARDWTVTKEEGGFRVVGARVLRLASGIAWDDPDAAAYFQRMILRTGVDAELRRLGVKEGDPVRIGTLELEWRESPE